MDEGFLCVAWFEGYSGAVSEERFGLLTDKYFPTRDNLLC
jgi:hypothetical protein